MSLEPKQISVLLELIRKYTTRADFEAFLKENNLPFSGRSWDELFSKRVWPALLEGELTAEKLLAFLRPFEEYGRQNVFLFHCTAAAALKLLDLKKVKKELRHREEESLLGQPKILDQPEQPTLVEVRLEPENDPRALILKVVETRVQRVLEGQDQKDGTVTLTYKLKTKRAVSVLCLHASGILEMRIQSHPSATLYDGEIDRLWEIAGKLLPNAQFVDYSIMDAKANLWAARASLANGLKYYFAVLRDTHGTALTAATGGQHACLTRDSGAELALDEFLRHDRAFTDETYIRFPSAKEATDAGEEDEVESTDEVQVRLLSKENEFAVSQCLQVDYEFAYEKVIELNRKRQPPLTSWARSARTP